MNYVEILTNAAVSAKVLASVLVSLCSVETGLKNVSNMRDPFGGSHGICQVSIRTAKYIEGDHITVKDLNNPYVNARIAAKYLKRLYDKYGNYEHAVAAYNMGHVRYKNNKLCNKKYVDKVLKLEYNIRNGEVYD